MTFCIAYCSRIALKKENLFLWRKTHLLYPFVWEHTVSLNTCMCFVVWFFKFISFCILLFVFLYLILISSHPLFFSLFLPSPNTHKPPSTAVFSSLAMSISFASLGTRLTPHGLRQWAWDSPSVLAFSPGGQATRLHRRSLWLTTAPPRGWPALVDISLTFHSGSPLPKGWRHALCESHRQQWMTIMTG